MTKLAIPQKGCVFNLSCNKYQHFLSLKETNINLTIAQDFLKKLKTITQDSSCKKIKQLVFNTCFFNRECIGVGLRVYFYFLMFFFN